MRKGSIHRRLHRLGFGALILLATLSALAGAKPDRAAHGKGSDLQIRRSTIDARGGESSGGGLFLKATIGQTDTTAMDGGAFKLYGGFWPPRAMATPGLILSDGFE